jgi:hypothetical protein
MPRKRNRTDENDEGRENTQMSMFETLSTDEWAEAGAPGTVSRGQYASILSDFAAAGVRYAKISLGDGSPLAGKSASTIATALKNARDSKNAPDGVGDNIKISGREKLNAVFLENTAVAQ